MYKKLISFSQGYKTYAYIPECILKSGNFQLMLLYLLHFEKSYNGLTPQTYVFLLEKIVKKKYKATQETLDLLENSVTQFFL